MPDQDRPQITLITPPVLDLDLFPDQLAAVMDQVAIACLRGDSGARRRLGQQLTASAEKREHGEKLGAIEAVLLDLGSLDG